MDLTTCDPEGKPWDFSDSRQRARAKKLVQQVKPILLIGSPMCRMFSKLQNLNRKRMGEENFQAAYRDAIEHLKFCLELYTLQERAGRYYLHEHPASASSWSLKEMVEFIASTNAGLSTMDMCMYGMRIQDQAIMKTTRWMSNAHYLLQALGQRCDGSHNHLPLIGGNKSQLSQVYPDKLCQAIISSLKEQLAMDEWGSPGVSIDCAGPASQGRGPRGAIDRIIILDKFSFRNP